jgi:hypothetical protein
VSILIIAGAILTLVAAAGGTAGYFKANVAKSTIELYKEDNTALRLRLDTLEAEKAADHVRIDALENANKFLASVVTQAEQIAYVRNVVERIAAKVGA